MANPIPTPSPGPFITRQNSAGSVFVDSPIITSPPSRFDNLPNINVSPNPDPDPDPVSNSNSNSQPKHTSNKSYLIISGGTGANSIASAFGHSPSFVLPVSDDGGSSSEILRCFGGPSIGDIRSRLIRLIPLVTNPDQTNKEENERLAIYNLLAYRFPSEATEKSVRELWHEIVEGRSDLWDGIGEDKKECIRAFLVHFQTLCLKRAHKRFSFRNFSLGNGFLTGARDLFGSLPSAIFLFKSIAGVNHGVQVIPVINTNQTVTIAAQLANSKTLVGQCTISHPTIPLTPLPTSPPTAHSHKSASPLPVKLRHHFRRDSRTFDTPDASLPTSRRASFDSIGQINEGEEGWSNSNSNSGGGGGGGGGGNLSYRKGEEESPLEARIERVFYINLYGQEIYPEPNPEFTESINQRDLLVYSCGSLWTSIIPCLALKGLASSIACSQTLKAKVLLLNSSNDRETPDYTASEYVFTILSMLKHYDQPKRTTKNKDNNHNHNQNQNQLIHHPPVPIWKSSDLISHVVYLRNGKVDIDRDIIIAAGIKLIEVPSEIHKSNPDGTPLFTPESVEWAMERVMDNL
ncbi:uncharacterized protein IL334_004782 [Kwoniella shivajii]|uniref:Uncharacterized protein n=1 Tax=Kwoniella shivajii TaxID=564305 RepID=A0ABZ1D1B1_9TREE|nr:hypothetical protein IL334_004782 [Kwoniella shivajii]